MSDNIREENAAAPADSPESPAAGLNEAANVPQEKPHHVGLAESALESSLSDVLPLSPIGGEPEKSNDGKSENKFGRNRRNRNASAKKNGASASAAVGVIDDPAQFTETLSGSGPKPRERRRDRQERREKAPSEAAPAEQPAAAAPSPSSEEVLPPNAAVAEKIEETRQGGSWRVQEKREKNFRHFQAKSGPQCPKLIIEPAPIPVQEEEPSFWSKLKARILSIFGVGKKKQKKNRHGRRRGGKRRGNRPFDKKDFHGNNQNGNGKKNFGRNRNSGFRGGNRNGGAPRPQGGKPENNG